MIILKWNKIKFLQKNPIFKINELSIFFILALLLNSDFKKFTISLMVLTSLEPIFNDPTKLDLEAKTIALHKSLMSTN